MSISKRKRKIWKYKKSINKINHLLRKKQKTQFRMQLEMNRIKLMATIERLEKEIREIKQEREKKRNENNRVI